LQVDVRQAFILFVFSLAGACQFGVDGLMLATAPSDGSTADGAISITDPSDLAGTDSATSSSSPDLLAPDLSPTTTPPDMTALPSIVGDTCTGQCANGLTCMTWVPAGYCSQPCNGGANACPSGSSCVDIGGGSHYCLIDENGGCSRSDLKCRDCGPSVCGPPSFCGGC
jgi:hypothetical protein